MITLSSLAFDSAADAGSEDDLARAFGSLMRTLHLKQGGAPGDAETIADAARRVSLATSEGHSCIEWGDGGALAASPVVAATGEGTASRPLVLDSGRLYLYRYWDYEHRLAGRLAGLNAEAALPADDSVVAAALDRLFPPGPVRPDGQKIAAATALTRHLAIVSGGPGTGKTTTVVKLLAILLRLLPAARIALAAPTGKAAARLQESVRIQCERLGLDEVLRGRFPATAYTVHRLLGTIPGSARFRHDARHPLPFDIVVVDEASMLDLALAAKLVEALPCGARLVLLGDKDQLASVEAGSVFSQLCAARASSPAFGARLARLTGEQSTADAVVHGALTDSVVWLEHSYRFGAQSGIGRLARAVNQGEADEALARLASGDADLAWSTLAPGTPPGAIAAALLEGYREYMEAVRGGADAARAMLAFERYRVLCALREGPHGARQLSAALETAFRAALGANGPSPWYAGRPVIATRNDYLLQIFNGDIGITLAAPDGGLLVHFPGADGRIRSIAPSRLSGCETAFAMTVHKAQGSEFDGVDLVLPEADSRVLTRELVYTAITRARRTAGIRGDGAVLAAAISRRTERRSGLAARLAG